MPLSNAQKTNFATLVKAAKHDRLSVMECTDTSTGEQVAVLCAVNYTPDDPDGKEYDLVPLGALLSGNPYDYLEPPSSTETMTEH
jgi:hypothetical protein